MLQEDYIMRLIRQASLVAGRIMELKRAADPNPLLEVISQAYDEILDVDPHQMEGWSEQDFDQWLKSVDWHPSQFELLANLLQTKGELLSAQGESPRAQAFLSRTIRVLDRAGEVEKVYSLERQTRIASLRQQLENHPGPQSDSEGAKH
ncbi:MAG: hypothetical protein AAFV95_06130 [Bacteroidota bacterium]